ncbi:DUF1877 domain-containing protein [Streptomyces cyaneus]|uniref:DUF1877 domain-containing protein n=1 Tax=Streptomyces cyaneus TaxID=1904 RepID=UPI000FF89964|nr:DUF1877 domain-containing protein [Streptomyces cyaneus]
MALTQQFARVTPAYLERCRTSARDSPGAAPGWEPPSDDLLDTDWAVWGLIRYCRTQGTEADLIALLDRAVSGDPGGDIARALDAVDIDAVLADLPATTEGAAAACGFGRGFNGDVRDYLVGHFAAMRGCYGGAARRGQCVVVWTD